MTHEDPKTITFEESSVPFNFSKIKVTGRKEVISTLHPTGPTCVGTAMQDFRRKHSKNQRIHTLISSWSTTRRLGQMAIPALAADLVASTTAKGVAPSRLRRFGLTDHPSYSSANPKREYPSCRTGSPNAARRAAAMSVANFHHCGSDNPTSRCFWQIVSPTRRRASAIATCRRREFLSR